MNRRRMIAAAAGAAALIASLASGAYSTFEVSAPAGQQPVASANLAVALGGAGTSESITVGADGLVGGSTVSREITVTNTGDVPFGALTLSGVPAGRATALVADPTDGLQVSVFTCSTRWTATGLADGGFAYACSGTSDTVAGPEPVTDLSAGLALPAPLGTLPAGSVASLVVRLELPTAAPNSMEGLSATIAYRLTATQPQGGPA